MNHTQDCMAVQVFSAASGYDRPGEVAEVAQAQRLEAAGWTVNADSPITDALETIASRDARVEVIQTIFCTHPTIGHGGVNTGMCLAAAVRYQDWVDAGRPPVLTIDLRSALP